MEAKQQTPNNKLDIFIEEGWLTVADKDGSVLYHYQINPFRSICDNVHQMTADCCEELELLDYDLVLHCGNESYKWNHFLAHKCFAHGSVSEKEFERCIREDSAEQEQRPVIEALTGSPDTELFPDTTNEPNN